MVLDIRGRVFFGSSFLYLFDVDSYEMIERNKLMKFEIHNGKLGDCFIVSGDTIEEVIKNAKDGTEKRGWDREYCYSIEVKE